MSTREAHLILADGTVYTGTSFGHSGEGHGEVVFNTSITGYQEILTDPSYQGQIVVMTYPQIGNYGVNPEDVESKKIYLSGFIVKEVSPVMSNFRARMDLSTYLKKNRVPGIEGIDTRSLVRKIRETGAMQALIHVGAIRELSFLKKKAARLPSMEGQDLAKLVSRKKTTIYPSTPRQAQGSGRTVSKPVRGEPVEPQLKVVAYDFGIKQNILRMLTRQGCRVKVVPADYPAQKVLDQNPDGVFLSNGPGDPAVCDYAVKNVQALLGKKPIFGICLGHQILGLALGGKTFKLKFGHHGGNQPVKDLLTGKVEITAQNHGFAVDPESLPKNIEVTHINLNDQTLEGLRHKKWQAFSVQYHPEASPGPHDSHYLFERFINMMK